MLFLPTHTGQVDQEKKENKTYTQSFGICSYDHRRAKWRFFLLTCLSPCKWSTHMKTYRQDCGYHSKKNFQSQKKQTESPQCPPLIHHTQEQLKWLMDRQKRLFCPSMTWTSKCLLPLSCFVRTHHQVPFGSCVNVMEFAKQGPLLPQVSLGNNSTTG